MERLQQVRLREPLPENRFQRWSHADGVTRRAVAARVRRALIILVVLMGSLITRYFMLGRSWRRSMVVTGVLMHHPRLEFRSRRRAKGHGCRRVALKGYGEHQEP